MDIDHLMLGAADLAAAVDAVAQRFGVRPEAGGAHPGLGTRNALLGLDGGRYLEIIAPDPAQALDGTFGAALAALDAPTLVTFAVACRDLEAVAGVFARHGYATRGPVPTRRRTPDGSLLAWELLFPREHPFGAVCPFFIDWGECRHPATGLPPAARLQSLTVRHPRAAALTRLFADLELDVSVAVAADAALQAELAGGTGLHRFESSARTAMLRFG